MSSPLLFQIPKSVSLTPSFQALLSHTTDSLHRGFSKGGPWQELFDFSVFSGPQSASHGTLRIRLSYFRINYITLLNGLLAFSFSSHPLSLISLLPLLSAWLFLHFFNPPEQPLILFGHTLSNNETLTALVMATVIVVFFTSIGSLLMSATLVGGVIICIHGAFRDPEDLFLTVEIKYSSWFLFHC